MFAALYRESYLPQVRGSSRVFRRVLVIVAIYALLRLLIQLTLVAGAFMPGETGDDFFPDDLRIYLEASNDLKHQRDLYPPLPLERMEFYQYAPAYALAYVPFSWLPRGLVVLIQTILHLAAYGLLYVWWDRIFERLKLVRAREMMAWTLPVWLLFSAFWSDLGFLNIYLYMALLATLLIDAVLAERLGWALLWLSIILQTKPQWAFAAVLPLLLGQYRFFAKLMILSAITYAAVVGLTLLVVGPAYGWEQHKDYWHLLTGIGNNYPWRGPDKPYLGYNHSIVQTVVYIFGINTAALRLATVIKIALLLPLGLVVLRLVRRRPAYRPTLALDLAFAFYTASFIWLDVVWELSLGIAVFTYLLATVSGRRVRQILWIVFLPYALVDIWQAFSFMIFGDSVMDPGPYVLTDPSIYIPLVMIVTVTFYAVLVRRLWLPEERV